MTVRDRRIYLDHNATAPLLPEARAALTSALDLVGNPSSVHREGRTARAVIEAARAKVAALVGAGAGNVVFTSGATEAAATCLAPDWVIDGETVRVTRLAVAESDHPCTRDGGRFSADRVCRLPVDGEGRLRLDALDGWIADCSAGNWAMLAVSLANSETGVLQNIDAVIRRIEGKAILLVVDAVQAAGRLPLAMLHLGADAVLLSGHKIGAAKGVGAYVLRDGARRPAALLTGGAQETRRRAGTEAVTLIASFGAAADVARARAEAGVAPLLRLRERLVGALRASGARFTLLGENADRLPNTLAIAAPGLRAETAQIALDLEGFAVSSGSACSSGKVGPSHVIAAMHAGGLAVDPSDGALRISFGHETSEAEIDLFTDAFVRLLRARQDEAGRRAA